MEVKISPYEQVSFLKRFGKGDLKFHPCAQKMTQKLKVKEKSNSGAELTGKTGSGFIGKDFELRIGWYVGVPRTGSQEYIVVMNFIDKQKERERKWADLEAKTLAKELLAASNLW